jgi:esterase/lipase superfamily enzyme
MKQSGKSFHHHGKARGATGRSLIVMLLACGLAGCARPGPDVLKETLMSVPGAKIATVYVATTRARAVPDRNIYTNARADGLNYGEFRISIPPGHQPGNIEWPVATSDPAVSFATVRQSVLDRRTFEQRIAGHENTSKGANVGVFVHGFNTNFQEALYRLAQLKADANVDGVPILFAWPSEAKVTGYIADKDAVTYSRDQLVDLLRMLAHDRKAGSITLFGHSMGGWLTVEALRQLRVAGDNAVISRLNVVLAAPDIDVDVFAAQMQVIGPLSPPMTVLVSRDDLALSLSSRLADHRKRVGALDVDDPTVQDVALKEKIEIIDISSLKAPDLLRHERYASFAALYPRLTEDDHDMRRAGAFVFDSVGATLAAPFNMLAGGQ